MSNLADIFDTDTTTLAALDIARETFEEWCANEHVPDSTIDIAQLDLMRWQRKNFGDQPDERYALGIIEEMCETFLADKPTDAEDAVDGLGDVCVYASQLATNNRLALAPILDLARTFTARSDVRTVIAHGTLAQVVLKGSQKIRGMGDPTVYRRRLVGALALCIAQAIENVEIIHDLSVKAAGVFVTIANEVMKRGDGHPGIPQQVPAAVVVSRTTTEERKAKAEQALLAATDGADQPGADFDLSDAGDKPDE